MSSGASEKTEKPTAQRLEKEGRKGKSFNSRDLVAAGVLWLGLPAIALLGSLAPLAQLYVDIVRGGFAMTPTAAALAALKGVLLALAPVLLAAGVGVVLCSLAMSRGRIATEAIRFDLNKLNPINGFKNLFSARVLKDLLRTVLYMVCCGLFGWLALGIWGSDLFSQVQASNAQLAGVWRHVALMFGLGLLLAMAPVYLLAGWLDHFLFIREMKMEKHEVKRERKDNEIKPEIKQRRQEVSEELSAQVQADTRGSTVVLANPTHIAIGIFLMDDDTPLPFVAVRERGARARKVIALAEANGVPVVRDIKLARDIYFSTRRYQFVHDRSIDPVMQIVRWLRDVERAGKPDGDSDAAPPDPSD
ncbi:EscU/YscU/HrcU family type III secretion system export apparatus switch protein [Stenotrophomonas sp. SORGH_AS_0321]|uniref:EscU/YscU/HrcU family type III secretion system export apparatus switch protein n=1 Tax=Stenotrophomonas sp. SORGH_AS_0321 TaxID=3041787 RepID=UPI0028560CBC|nr:EscU/YscU/HrcU family type III secretion system export apparatus switch protein [Stenotrophomonas sp. SORGH_AS_0321]MDR6092751.1 flagellar biosynthesis protein FlhB [Stenotrophomonas sp. SORGH_AS_0321]